MENSKRDLLTNEYLNYLNANNGKIKTTDKTRMKNANTTYLKYLYSEQRFVKLNEHRDDLNDGELYRIKCYYKIIEAKKNIKNKFKIVKESTNKKDIREKLTEEYILYLTLNDGVIKATDKTHMPNTNTNYYSYLQNEQAFIQSIEEKINQKIPLTDLEHHRVKCFCKIINIKEKLAIERRNMITDEYINYLILTGDSISKNDKTRMNLTNTTYCSYLDIEANYVANKRQEMDNPDIYLKESEIHRIECYFKILEKIEELKIIKRNLLTDEYIKYLKESGGMISRNDKTRMQYANTTYYNYLYNEKVDAISKIEQKINEGQTITKVEKNRLENYYRIIEIKNKLNGISLEDNDFSNSKQKIK